MNCEGIYSREIRISLGAGLPILPLNISPVSRNFNDRTACTVLKSRTRIGNSVHVELPARESSWWAVSRTVLSERGEYHI